MWTESSEREAAVGVVRGGVATVVVVVLLGLTGGCRSEECARMEACCEAIDGMEGVGGACGEKGSAVGDPQTCETILETVQLMFRDREESVPKVCLLRPEKG